MATDDRLRRLHPMRAFGVVGGLTTQVRASRLETRLVPAVPFPHKHDFVHIVVPLRGRGWHEIDFQRYELRRGRLFLMKPAQVHSWHFSPQTTGYVIEFEAGSVFAKTPAHRAVSRLLQSSPDCLDADGAAWSELTTVCELMARAYERRDPEFEAALQAYLTALLLVLVRLAAPADESGRDGGGTVGAFLALLDDHHRVAHDVDFYARRLRLTPKALTMRVTRAAGRAPRALIQDRLVLESKRLLAYSDLTIGVVAEELGFTDPNYFARFFRGKTGVSPGRFRTLARRLC